MTAPALELAALEPPRLLLRLILGLHAHRGGGGGGGGGMDGLWRRGQTAAPITYPSRLLN